MNKKMQDLVKEFHQVYGHPIFENWSDESFYKTRKLRVDLITEEFTELTKALYESDKIEMIDGLMDLLYVTYGAALCFGMHLNDPKIECMPYVTEPLENKINIWKIAHEKVKFQVESVINSIESVYDIDETKDDIDNIEFDLQSLVENICLMTSLMNVDVNRAFNEVHISNMTKVCSNEMEAKDTILSYMNKNVESSYRKMDSYWVVYDIKTGKILKNINYKPVDLSWVNLNE